MASKVTCSNCGWSWNKSDSSKKDMYVCHQCGRDNSNKSERWLDKYDDGGTMQEYQENYNDYSVSAPEEMQGDVYSNVGRDYSPAWGGQFQGGGELRQAQTGISFLPEQDPEMIYRNKFNTELNKEEKKEFNEWITKESKRRGRDILMDKGAYDVQGFWKSGDYKNIDEDNHGSDKWKKPNHPTFSNQSKYHGVDGFYGGNWTEEAGYQPSKQTADMYSPDYYKWMFSREPNRPEHLDNSRFESGANSPSPLYYAMGGSLPGAVGFTYARTGDIPSNGKYAKKTLASAKKGGVVKDDNGYWNPDNHGKVVEIDSPYITMEGVDEPLLGISDEGDKKYMLPGKNYKFKGKKVREYPMAKNGKRQEQKGLINLDDLLNFTNYNIPKAYEGMELSTTTDTTTVNPNSPENKKLYGSPDEKSIDQFYRDYYNSPLFKKNIGISESKISEYPNITASSDPKLINSILAKHAGVSTTYDPGKITAYDLGSNVNLGSSYDDVFQNRGLTYAHEKSHINETDILKRQPKMVDFLINKNKLSTKYDKRDIEEYNKSYANFQDEYSPVTHERVLTKAEGQQNALERLLKQKQQYTSELTHDNAPTEIRADIMGLRYAAAQAGIWDPTKPNAGNFTPEMLQKLYKLQKLNLPMKGRSFNKPYELIAPNKESLRKSNLPAVDAPKSPGLFLDRTRQRFDDSDLLYLMNNLAQNQSPMTGEMTTGKDGAKVKKGWLEKYN